MRFEALKKWMEKLKKWLRLLLNWRILVCFFVAWMITNGWSYLMLGIGIYLNHSILIAISSAYLALLWVPFSPEKILTVAIGLFLVRILFPKHNREIKRQISELLEQTKEKRKEKKRLSQGKTEAEEE